VGSYCTLRFDKADAWSVKSYVPDELICLFQETDRQEGPSRNPADEAWEGETAVYTASRKVVLKRLDLMGCTSEAARRAFEEWRSGEHEMHQEWVAEGSEWARSDLQAIEKLSYEGGNHGCRTSWQLFMMMLSRRTS
jgi:hypothetical protein